VVATQYVRQRTKIRIDPVIKMGRRSGLRVFRQKIQLGPKKSKPVQASPTCVFHPTAVALFNSESPLDGCERVRTYERVRTPTNTYERLRTPTNASMTMNAIHHENLCRHLSPCQRSEPPLQKKKPQMGANHCKGCKKPAITANGDVPNIVEIGGSPAVNQTDSR
jgi:hypothetical protein